MRHLWIFGHLLGMVMWLGGAIGAMTVSLRSRSEPRENLPPISRALTAIYRSVILPGVLLTVISGIALTLIVFGGPGATAAINRPLMLMQATGLIAALIILVLAVPNVSRLARLDPVTQAPQFDALRKRQALIGMIAGLFGLIALIAGAAGRP
jgi:hypothetical protein